MTRPAATLLHSLPMPAGLKWRIASRIGSDSKTGDSHHAVTRMREGFRMTLDLRESYERTMYYSGLYNPWLTHIFKRILRPGDTVIDGGANIGFFSLLAAKCVGPTGRVHSFEPIPATFAQLSENIKLNGYANITANRNALAAQAGQIEFEVPLEADTNLGLGRLATTVISGRGQRVVVQSRMLDEYTTQGGIGHIRLIKFDLEGSEVFAIMGMQRTLRARQIDYLICELNVPLLDQQGIPHSALRDSLAAYGYEAYYISNTGGFRRPLRVTFIPVPEMPRQDIYGDYLFVAPGKPVPQMHG